ncbi:MAG: Hsp33 family molecular chaperone HslO [Acidobacteriota bacterium]
MTDLNDGADSKLLLDAIPPGQEGLLRLGVAGGGDLRWAVVDLTTPVEAARQRLDMAPLPAVALGRAMAAAVLLLRFSTKQPGRLRFEVMGRGPLGRVTAEADDEGFLRGMVDELRFPGFEDDPLAVGRAVGSGLLRVTQDFAGRPEPWISQTALVDGEIGNDLVHFLHQSQQVRSAALLGVTVKPSGVVAAGGLLVEALPGAREESVEALEGNIAGLPGVGELIIEGGERALGAAVLAGLEVEELEQHTIRYACRCRRDTLLDRLRTLPEADLREAADPQGRAILQCGYCHRQFVFSLDELMPPPPPTF